MASRASTRDRVEVAILGMACATVAVEVIAVLHFTPPYQTDEAALLQAAGTLVLHGRNPYGVDLARAYSTFHVSPYRLTPLASGGFVRRLEYPGLAVLVSAVVVWVTHGYQATVVADTAALIMVTVTGFVLLPAHLRGLAIVAVLALPGMTGLALDGLIAVSAIPSLVFAVWRWDAIGLSGRLGRLGTAQAAALGMACALSQIAWLVAPFLLIVIWRQRQRELGWRIGAALSLRYILIAAAIFAVSNFPFMFASPSAWSSSLGAPMFQHSIPLGLGLAALPVLTGVGGGFLAGYGVGAACLYLALLAAIWPWFDRLRSVALVLPALPTLVSTRALTEYWVLLVPVWLVAAATVAAQPRDSRRPSLAKARRAQMAVKALSAALAMAGLAAIGLAVTSPAPLSVAVTSAPIRGVPRSTAALGVRVKNLTDEALTPHFVVTVQIGTAVWLVRSGPHELAPGETASYELVPPNPTYEVPAAPVQVGVLTNDPETISVSPLAIASRQ